MEERMRRIVLTILLSALTALAGEGWKSVRTAHFEVWTTGSPESALEALERLEFLRTYFAQAGTGLTPSDKPVRVVAFSNSGEFEPYRPNSHSPAYFVGGPERDVLVLGRLTREDLRHLSHEYVHAVVRQSGLHLPVWLEEGLAEFHSTVEPANGGVLVGRFPDWKRKKSRAGQRAELAQLMSVGQRSAEYRESSLASRFYTESWVLVHMLQTSPRYRTNAAVFLRLSSEEGVGAAVQGAFNVSAEQVERDYQSYEWNEAVHVALREKLESEPWVVSEANDEDVSLQLVELQSRIARMNGASASRSAAIARR
jgi:hypothetical protein